MKNHSIGGPPWPDYQQPSRSLDNMCQVACLWLGCCKGIYSSSHCHITTCDIGVIEKHDLFFGHNWLSIWIEIQLQFANCIILIESFYNLLKLKSTCSHWIIWSFYLKLIQFWSIIKSPSCLLLFQELETPRVRCTPVRSSAECLPSLVVSALNSVPHRGGGPVD